MYILNVLMCKVGCLC